MSNKDLDKVQIVSSSAAYKEMEGKLDRAFAARAVSVEQNAYESIAQMQRVIDDRDNIIEYKETQIRHQWEHIQELQTTITKNQLSFGIYRDVIDNNKAQSRAEIDAIIAELQVVKGSI